MNKDAPANRQVAPAAVRALPRLRRRNETVILKRPAMAPSGTRLFGYLKHRLQPLVVGEYSFADPKYIGHMAPPIPAYLSAVSAVLTAVNPNVVKRETARVFTNMERELAARMHRLFYGTRVKPEQAIDPAKTYAIFTNGGTTANYTALWMARARALDQGEHNKASRVGVALALRSRTRNRPVIICGALSHYSLTKAADLLGIGEENLLSVAVDQAGRMRIDDLEQTIAEAKMQRHAIVAVVGVAGTTETGAIDDLRAIAKICKREGIHFHVDAALGGALQFSPRHRRLLAGIDQADSITVCAHKALRCPMGLSMLVLRDPSLAKSIEKRARYIIREGSPDLGRRSIEGSRPANSIYLDARLHVEGPEQIASEVDYSIALARAFGAMIRNREEFALIDEPQTQIVTWVYVPRHLRSMGLTQGNAQEISELTRGIQGLLGESFVSRTTVSHTGHGEIDVFRAVLINPGTTPAHLEEVLGEIVRVAEAKEALPHA